MQGFWFSRAGTAKQVLQFGERAIPQPVAGEVGVQVHFSAVNPTDTKRRSDGRELSRFSEITPNNDGSGVIVSVGDGVPENRIGERVWLFAAQAGRPHGTGAQFCTVPAAYAVPLPAKTSFEIGACLGVPAVTAHRALFADGPIEGQSILITGGTGRVGRYAVQMAQSCGARVIATCSSEQSRLDLLSLGLEHVIMRGSEDIPGRVLTVTDGLGVDRMIDVAFGANIHHAAQMIKANGVLTSYGSDENPEPSFPFYQFMFRNITVRPFSIMGMPEQAKTKAFEDIISLLHNERLKHAIGARFEFKEMIPAHEAIESGNIGGCVLVRVA